MKHLFFKPWKNKQAKLYGHVLYLARGSSREHVVIWQAIFEKKMNLNELPSNDSWVRGRWAQ